MQKHKKQILTSSKCVATNAGQNIQHLSSLLNLTNGQLSFKFLSLCKINRLLKYFKKDFVYFLTRALDRPWWHSGLERVSNSSGCLLKDPGLNPPQGGCCSELVV